jgi:hypothetical protein
MKQFILHNGLNREITTIQEGDVMTFDVGSHCIVMWRPNQLENPTSYDPISFDLIDHKINCILSGSPEAILFFLAEFIGASMGLDFERTDGFINEDAIVFIRPKARAKKRRKNERHIIRNRTNNR